MPAPKKTGSETERLATTARRLRAAYENRTKITAVEYGFKEGQTDGDLVLRVHVAVKLDKNDLEKASILPEKFDGIEVDVIEADYATSDAIAPRKHKQRFETLAGGISCGRLEGGAGTLGALVIDETDGGAAILSNWHVLTGANGTHGDKIVQPAILDRGDPATDVIARLGRSIIEPHGDAAIGHLDDVRPWLPIAFGSYDTFKGARAVKIGDILRKSGRTTGVTEARVEGIGEYGLTYETRPGRFERIWVRGFKLAPVDPANPNDIEVSAGGDSGSVWYDPATGEGVGLHFAGEVDRRPTQEHAVACHIVDVLDRLDIRLASFEDVMELAIEAEAKSEPAQLAPQYTPNPIDPWPGPWPFPTPWPPYPWPYPWHDWINAPINVPGWNAGRMGHGWTRRPQGTDTETGLEVDSAVLDKIWEELKLALETLTGDASMRDLSRGDSTSKIAKTGHPAILLAQAIAKWPPFKPIQPPITPAELWHMANFRPVVSRIYARLPGGL